MFCSSRIVHPYRRNQPWFQVYTSVCPRGARRENNKNKNKAKNKKQNKTKQSKNNNNNKKQKQNKTKIQNKQKHVAFVW